VVPQCSILCRETQTRSSRWPRVRKLQPLPRFLVLYSAMFSAFGVASPFLPGLLVQDGLTPAALGVVLAGGTAIRLVAGPLGGRLADGTGRPSTVLAAFGAVSALIATGYAVARGMPLLFLISIAHAAALAPLTPVADALALGSAGTKPGFNYGWVRGTGSAAFIIATLASGYLVGRFGLGIIVWLNASLLAVAAGLSLLLPDRVAGATRDTTEGKAGSFLELLHLGAFKRLMVIVALIGGSHALHDSFEVIRWRAAGMSTGQASLLWAISVAAEVLVFVFLGRWMLERLGPKYAMMLAAGAGVVRWSTAALTARFAVMAIVEPLHGFTFALLHLACMACIGKVVPRNLAATAQAFYATIAMGATSAFVTLFSGSLYGHFGAAAFWAMTAMCAVAMPLAAKVSEEPAAN
jgi:PPP family 3-phenylpropionic acid transporter